MAEKVTLRFEQFDSETSSDILSSGPVVIDKTLDTTAQLDNLVLYGTSGDDTERPGTFNISSEETYPPIVEGQLFLENMETLYIGTAEHTLVVLSVENGTYFFSSNENTFYEYTNNKWINKPVQNVIVYVRNVTDEVKTLGMYFMFNSLTASWQEVLLGTHSHANKDVLDQIGLAEIEPGTRKFLTLELTDDIHTYEYDVKWRDIPDIKGLPEVPEDDTELYLGHDDEGNPEWKNMFIAAQTFQLEQKEATPGTQISFSDIVFDPRLDEALIIVDKFFVVDRSIQYTPENKTLTIILGSDYFSGGENVSLLIIRNGAAAVLDTLAKDYISKAEAINILSGGSVNLRDYIKRTDLTDYAKRYHTHSQYAPTDHNHDFRYAKTYHTHAQYLTRTAALELIERVIAVNPDIIENLSAISDYLIQNTPELENILASKADIQDLQAQIDEINNTLPTRLQQYLDSEIQISTDRVKTNILDEGNDPKNLTEVLEDIRRDLDEDYGNIHSDEVITKNDITVYGDVGGYLDGAIIREGTTLESVLTQLLRKRIAADYIQPEYSITYEVPNDIEANSEIEITAKPVFIKGDAGAVKRFTIRKNIIGDPVTEILHDGAIVHDVVFETRINTPGIILSSSIEYAEGAILQDNLGGNISGHILEGETPVDTQILKGSDPVLFKINDILAKKYITGHNFIFHVPESTQKIEIIVPKSKTLNSILYREQGLNMEDDFETADIYMTRPGSEEYLATVYTLNLLLPLSSSMTLEVSLEVEHA